MSMCARTPHEHSAAPIITEERDPQDCPDIPLPPEGSVKLRNYRFVNDNLLTYTPIGDGFTSLSKGKFVSKIDVLSTISPPRAKILELLRPEDPGTEALEAIVRPSPRRGLIRPYDEDTRRFLQRALLSPNYTYSNTTSETNSRLSDTEEKNNDKEKTDDKKERSLADELREAEEDEQCGIDIRRELLKEFRKRGGGIREAMERDRLGKLALSVEDDEEYEDCGLSAAARQLDALLVESRSLHEELAGIHEDIQVLARRVARRDL